MLHYFKFRQDLFDPQPAKDLYVKHGPGKGWPDECPPLRAAAAFGFDVLANFNLTFINKRGQWSVEKDVVISSDFEWSNDDQSPGTPLMQQYAWFWQKGQTIPHVISDNVFPKLRNQVKISSFLFLKTDPNELLYMTDVPNLHRPYRAMTAVIDADWYAASYPWHLVLELDPSAKKIVIPKGEPLCRVFTVRRDTYFAQPMTAKAFDEFFQRSQQWVGTHGRVPEDHTVEDVHPGTMDIRGSYQRQAIRAKFVVR